MTAVVRPIPVHETPPRLNDAVDELVQAVEGVEDLPGLRLGVLKGVRMMQLSVLLEDGVATPELDQAVGVWMALDALVDAVDAMREARRG